MWLTSVFWVYFFLGVLTKSYYLLWFHQFHSWWKSNNSNDNSTASTSDNILLFTSWDGGINVSRNSNVKSFYKTFEVNFWIPENFKMFEPYRRWEGPSKTSKTYDWYDASNASSKTIPPSYSFIFIANDRFEICRHHWRKIIPFLW